jgi:hypothetical protein
VEAAADVVQWLAQESGETAPYIVGECGFELLAKQQRGDTTTYVADAVVTHAAKLRVRMSCASAAKAVAEQGPSCCSASAI